MVQKVRSLGITGISGFDVSVECSISQGLPAFDIVGLPDTAVKEARERVRSAIKNSGFKFPVSHITINLAPADVKKAGTVYDLPILLCILAASGAISPLPQNLAFLGEISLSGEVRPINGALPMALAAEKLGISDIFLPDENALEASFAEGVNIHPVSSLSQIIAHLTGSESIPPAAPPDIYGHASVIPDFADVKGQENVKRALEIASAGGHNILMVGPPGSGKSMLAKRLPSILPDMTHDEIIETTGIHSIMGLTSKAKPVINIRPFRSPHHTLSSAAMSGGGSNPRPGEISLAHNGVLFLDELPEFRSETLEALRQPLEDGKVTISRVSGSITYPSRFMLVCAMNPCKCGWYGHPSGRCTCSTTSVNKYLGRISGPLLDRIDILVNVPALDYSELRQRSASESSSDIKARVNAARDIQTKRYAENGISCNAHMDTKLISRYCILSPGCDELMRGAYEKMGLTARSYDRILRVARTIADLDGSETILPQHLAEAIQYRTYDFNRQ